MEKWFLFSVVISLILKSEAYDLLEGLFAQSTPCFETIHDETCNTSIPEVFEPEYKGVNINIPYTQVHLFTYKNQDKAEPLHKCGGKLPPDSDFDPNLETVFIAHGWLDGMCRTAWMREIRNQLFVRGKYNIILVDWTWGNIPDPVDAAFNAIVTGEQVGFVIKNIMKEKNMNGDKFHLIGHSFGSFVASFAGKAVQRWRKAKKIRRITTLDPAVAPLRSNSERNKVSPNDAKFVDVIHSNGGACFPFFLGNNMTLGHLDFYVNGGKVQPSCIPYAIRSLTKGDIFYGLASLLSPMICNHFQSIQFFKVSINHPSGVYIGVRCNSYEEFQSGACKRCCKEDFSNCAVAGMDSEYYYSPTKNPQRQAKYYFNTHDICPFPEDYAFSINKDCTDN